MNANGSNGPEAHEPDDELLDAGQLDSLAGGMEVTGGDDTDVPSQGEQTYPSGY